MKHTNNANHAQQPSGNPNSRHNEETLTSFSRRESGNGIEERVGGAPMRTPMARGNKLEKALGRGQAQGGSYLSSSTQLQGHGQGHISKMSHNQIGNKQQKMISNYGGYGEAGSHGEVAEARGNDRAREAAQILGGTTPSFPSTRPGHLESVDMTHRQLAQHVTEQSRSPQYGNRYKLAAASGKEKQHGQLPGVAHKSKGKKGKGHKSAAQDANLSSAILQRSQSPGKKRHRGAGQHSHNFDQTVAGHGAAGHFMLASHPIGGGQGAGGGNGRRRLVADGTAHASQPNQSQKTSQHRLNPSGIQHAASASKATGGHQGHGGSHRKGGHGSVNQAQSSQACAYAAQIKQAAERGVGVGGYSGGRSGGKHHGHRKHQPVAIDTFNIVSNRRTSLIKQVNEAAGARAGLSQSFAQTPQKAGKAAELLADTAEKAKVGGQGGPQGGSGARTEGELMGLSLQASAGGLVLPDIMSQSKSGMSHATGHNPNLTPGQTPGPPHHQNHGSHSFSGICGQLASAGGPEGPQHKVWSETSEQHGRRPGGGHPHARTQQSADLQAQMQGKLYPAPVALSHAANDYLSIAQSLDNKGAGANGGNRSGGRGGPRGVDLKRRTTGSLFQIPNAQTMSSLVQGQLNGALSPSKPSAVLSHQGLSAGGQANVANRLNKRIQNIVSPIKDGSPGGGSQMVSNNIISMTDPNDVSECPNTEPRTGAADAAGAVAGYPSTLALDQNLQLLATQSSPCEDGRPHRPPLHSGSEHQSLVGNSVFYDSIVHRVDAAGPHESRGSRGNTGTDYAASVAVSHHEGIRIKSQANDTPGEPDGGVANRSRLIGRTGPVDADESRRAVVNGQRAQENSANCRADTELSTQGYLVPSQDGETNYDKIHHNLTENQRETRQTEGGAAHGQASDQQVRRAGRNAPPPQGTVQGNRTTQYFTSGQPFQNRREASYLEQDESGGNSGDSGTSEDEDDEEEDDSVLKGPHHEQQLLEQLNSRADDVLSPQPQDMQVATTDGLLIAGKPKKSQGFQDQTDSKFLTSYQQQHEQRNAQQNHGPTGGGSQKKKSKKHRRQNTHHHYHIDFNFEQVNNILVSYGGLGLQQSLKHHGKKENSKAANVSLSVGVVHGGQVVQGNQTKGGANTAQVPANNNIHNTPNPSAGAGGVTSPSPNKRGQIQQANGILLPELIINKNKINFGSKQYKINQQDDSKIPGPRQLREAAQNLASYNLGQHLQGPQKGGDNKGAKSKRKRHKKNEQNHQSVPLDEYLPVSPNRRHGGEKYRGPKRQQISQGMGAGVAGHTPAPYQSAEARPSNLARGDAGNLVYNNRMPHDQSKVYRQSQASMHKKGSTSGTQMDQLDARDSQRNRRALSQASNTSKGSADSGREQSPVAKRERPAAQHQREGRKVRESGGKPAGEMQWNSARRNWEKVPGEIPGPNYTEPKQQAVANFGSFRGGAGGPLAGSVTAKGGQALFSGLASPTKQGQILIGSAAAGGTTLRARQKQPLYVQTRAGAVQGTPGQAVETPKRFFNVKGHIKTGGSRARMTVVDHHSAGLRPGQRNTDPEDTPARLGEAAYSYNNAHNYTLGAVAVKGGAHTLSQISSVLSENGTNKDAARRESATGGRPTVRGSSFLPPRTQKVKTILREQERKLKQIDAQTRRTHQMLEQFNNKAQASTFDLQTDGNTATDGALSPARRSEAAKQVKPQITDFEIEGIVGIGNFGKVHKAFNTREGRVCALKALRKESVAAMKHVDHIINELEVLQYLGDRNREGLTSWENEKQLRKEDDDEEEDDTLGGPDCPFLMGMYSTFQDKENLYFELEYVQGCTLLSQIREYNQAVQKNWLFYTAEVLTTLKYLHSHNVIYRDLKPENIVISMTDRGHIKLVDFGFAKRLSNLSQRTFTNCGTPAYLSPEVLIENKGHGPEVDVWGLGVLMAEIVSGTTPFHAESTVEVYENINKCQPVYTKLIGAAMRDLLSKVFVKDAEVRITLQQMQLHKLFEDWDWEVPTRQRYWYTAGPFIPKEAVFNEQADRASEEKEQVKPKNILAAIMGNPLEDVKKKPFPAILAMHFDEAHYNKFERADGRANADGADHSPSKRKRQNPLGDFKFVKINELF